LFTRATEIGLKARGFAPQTADQPECPSLPTQVNVDRRLNFIIVHLYRRTWAETIGPVALVELYGWMSRLLIETLLGVNQEGDQLRLAACLPKT
jgi:hypothetical protein